MNHISNKDKQAAGGNWGKPDASEKKITEKTLRNSTEEVNKKKAKKNKKEKIYNVGDVYEFSGAYDSNLSVLDRGKALGHSFLFRQFFTGTFFGICDAKFEVKVESKEVNKRSKKLQYFGEIIKVKGNDSSKAYNEHYVKYFTGKKVIING